MARSDSLIAIVIFLGYALLVTGWSGTLFLEEPGARYLIPAIPFLVVPLAHSWPKVARVGRICGIWGASLMIAATITVNLVPHDQSIVFGYIRYVARGQFRPTIWSIAFGPVGVLMYAASAVLATRWLWQTAKTRPHG